MNKIIALVAVSLGSILIVGCQAMPYQPYARQVKVMPKKGGIVAMNVEHRDEDRVKAESLMQKACANKTVDIVEEGEVVIGSITNASESSQRAGQGKAIGSIFGIPVTASPVTPAGRNVATETTNKKEWQIQFNCGKIAKNKSNRVVR